MKHSLQISLHNTCLWNTLYKSHYIILVFERLSTNLTTKYLYTLVKTCPWKTLCKSHYILILALSLIPVITSWFRSSSFASFDELSPAASRVDCVEGWAHVLVAGHNKSFADCAHAPANQAIHVHQIRRIDGCPPSFFANFYPGVWVFGERFPLHQPAPRGHITH